MKQLVEIWQFAGPKAYQGSSRLIRREILNVRKKNLITIEYAGCCSGMLVKRTVHLVRFQGKTYVTCPPIYDWNNNRHITLAGGTVIKRPRKKTK